MAFLVEIGNGSHNTFLGLFTGAVDISGPRVWLYLRALFVDAVSGRGAAVQLPYTFLFLDGVPLQRLRYVRQCHTVIYHSMSGDLPIFAGVRKTCLRYDSSTSVPS